MPDKHSPLYSSSLTPNIDRLKFLRAQFDSVEIQEWLLKDGTREELICWLVWNDANGVYTDADSLAEGYAPLSLELARETMQVILLRDQ